MNSAAGANARFDAAHWIRAALSLFDGSPRRRGMTAICVQQTTGADVKRTAGVGRVEVWRGDVRLSMSVSAPFVWRCLRGSAVGVAQIAAYLAGVKLWLGISSVAG